MKFFVSVIVILLRSTAGGETVFLIKKKNYICCKKLCVGEALKLVNILTSSGENPY